jgi:hypothetical protein
MTDTVDAVATEVNPLDNEILKLEFTVKDINAILNVLGNLPFVQAVGLINAIQAQCGPQVDAFIKAQEEAKNEPQATA